MTSRVLVAVLGLCAMCACTHDRTTDARNRDVDFSSFLERFEGAQEAFINGDATEWKANSSQSPDATIFGGFGGFEKGWIEVEQRYDWAAAQFQASGATKTIDYLSTGVSGDLAFTVAIEHSQVRTGGQSKGAELALRVTQVFRRESGVWKLLHRHADPLVEKKAPAS